MGLGTSAEHAIHVESLNRVLAWIMLSYASNHKLQNDLNPHHIYYGYMFSIANSKAYYVNIISNEMVTYCRVL